MAHDLLSPSSATTWANCPGAMALVAELQITDTASVYAAEGTAAHEQAERAANAAFGFTSYVPSTDDADMIRHARGWAEMLTRHVNPKQCAFYAVERPLDISVVTAREDAHGTADFIAIDVDHTLTIADFKYGMGVEVEAEKNLQLSIYALAAMDEFADYGIDAVRLIIYQPRICAEEKVYEWNIPDLLSFGRGISSAARLAASFIGNYKEAITALRPGEKQCRFCKAKAVCPAMREKTKAIIAADFDVIPESYEIPVPSDPDQVSRALKWLGAIENWCEAVRSYAMNMAVQGTPVPGFKLVAGKRGVRKWTPDAEEKLKWMRINRNVLYKKTLISPTQAEKAMKEGHIGPRQWAHLSQFINQAEGKPTLAPEKDKRPAIAIAVKDDFSILE